MRGKKGKVVLVDLRGISKKGADLLLTIAEQWLEKGLRDQGLGTLNFLQALMGGWFFGAYTSGQDNIYISDSILLSYPRGAVCCLRVPFYSFLIECLKSIGLDGFSEFSGRGQSGDRWRESP